MLKYQLFVLSQCKMFEIYLCIDPYLYVSRLKLPDTSTATDQLVDVNSRSSCELTSSPSLVCAGLWPANGRRTEPCHGRGPCHGWGAVPRLRDRLTADDCGATMHPPTKGRPCAVKTHHLRCSTKDLARSELLVSIAASLK